MSSRSNKSASPLVAKPRELRCAIYTRKSTDEGLEQSFNSLHAQREACVAYVASQAGEGWTCLPTLYDDGGFSGATMSRPGLERLLVDVERGLIDVVVVYKVDRLTRSLTDFAKIVDRFDQRQVSFVSVTQAFNTTSSMGRLTLNVLLSFAQFERDVTGERIRDKIALSKQKGMWMNGRPPFGYDIEGRSLVVNETEAELVRHIYRRYLELGSVHRLRDELEAQGARSRSRTTPDGRVRGGNVFQRGALLHALKNRHYCGEIVHRDKVYPGLHSAIVNADLFKAVQAMLKANVVERRDTPRQSAELLLPGKLFDANGESMSPSFGYGKGGKAYTYYISMAHKTGAKLDERDATIPRRLNALMLDRAICDHVRRLTSRHELGVRELRPAIQRVELRRRETHIVIDTSLVTCAHAKIELNGLTRRLEGAERGIIEPGGHLRLILPGIFQRRGGRTYLDSAPTLPAAPAADIGLIEGLRSSHIALHDLKASPLSKPQDTAFAQSPQTHHRRQLARLPFLAPDLQIAILRGAQPKSLTLRRLLKTELPLAWVDQRALFA